MSPPGARFASARRISGQRTESCASAEGAHRWFLLLPSHGAVTEPSGGRRIHGSRRTHLPRPGSAGIALIPPDPSPSPGFPPRCCAQPAEQRCIRCRGLRLFCTWQRESPPCCGQERHRRETHLPIREQKIPSRECLRGRQMCQRRVTFCRELRGERCVTAPGTRAVCCAVCVCKILIQQMLNIYICFNAEVLSALSETFPFGEAVDVTAIGSGESCTDLKELILPASVCRCEVCHYSWAGCSIWEHCLKRLKFHKMASHCLLEKSLIEMIATHAGVLV